MASLPVSPHCRMSSIPLLELPPSLFSLIVSVSLLQVPDSPFVFPTGQGPVPLMATSNCALHAQTLKSVCWMNESGSSLTSLLSPPVTCPCAIVPPAPHHFSCMLSSLPCPALSFLDFFLPCSLFQLTFIFSWAPCNFSVLTKKFFYLFSVFSLLKSLTSHYVSSFSCPHPFLGLIFVFLIRGIFLILQMLVWGYLSQFWVLFQFPSASWFWVERVLSSSLVWSCFSLPKHFSGTLPGAGAHVSVRGAVRLMCAAGGGRRGSGVSQEPYFLSLPSVS